MTTHRHDLDRNEILFSYKATIEDDGTLIVSFPGPPDSFYEGGTFQVKITLPTEYPNISPSVGFLTRVYHPNVDEQSGSICLDVISKTWSPMFSLKNIIDSFLPQLLQYPNADDPLNHSAAKLFLSNPDQYEKKVRQYVQTYAVAEEEDSLSNSTLSNASNESNLSNASSVSTLIL